MTAVTVGGTEVLLVNVDGQVCAYHDRCPHQESSLADGDFDGKTITCATHLWEFDARTGDGINPASSTLTRYGCRVDEAGMIHVDVPG